MIYCSDPEPDYSPPYACELYRAHEVQKKKPWQLKDALDYVRENAGTQFDPYWADILLSCEDELTKFYTEERKTANE